MTSQDPFVVTVASEKGGVGKTTIATNLAVYLKALQEDLPVTVASFDNHFTVDGMFAIGGRRGRTVDRLFEGTPAADLAELGEYGVQFIASVSTLTPRDTDLLHLRRALAVAPLPGILVLDTRPVLDYFTRNALLAADLILVPIKDRPSLVNAASIQRVLREADGDPDKIWLLPSLVDHRLRLRGKVGMAEFLTSSALERGYQVLPTSLSKSPRVEGLTTGFSSRVRPVLTHASGTSVHRQLRQLADFVLARRAGTVPQCRRGGTCPVCGREIAEEGFLFQTLRHRRFGYMHRSCMGTLLEILGVNTCVPEEGLLAVRTEGAGFSGPEAEVTWLVLGSQGEKVEEGHPEVTAILGSFLERASDRDLTEFGRECLLIPVGQGPPSRFLEGEGRVRLAALRRSALKEFAAW